MSFDLQKVAGIIMKGGDRTVVERGTLSEIDGQDAIWWRFREPGSGSPFFYVLRSEIAGVWVFGQ